jgi:hypothetical protein
MDSPEGFTSFFIKRFSSEFIVKAAGEEGIHLPDIDVLILGLTGSARIVSNRLAPGQSFRCANAAGLAATAFPDLP